jgi:hypothetical protein
LIAIRCIARDKQVHDVGINGGKKDIEIELGEKSFELVQCSVLYVGHTGPWEFINAANFVPIAVSLGWLGEVFLVRQSVRQSVSQLAR